ncbi:MAG: DUF87 domain-containing protein [Candidatus Pacearchaeota archaeon]
MPYDIIIGRDESDKKRFGNKGLIRIGKGYVRMGQYISLSNPIFIDVARSHVILIAGKRGSGKSYTIGAIAEEISQLDEESRKSIAPLIFDTMGIFWTMKYENEKDKELLEKWGLKPKKLPIRVFAPYGYFNYYLENGIAVDEKFSIKASDLNAEDWVSIFGLNIIEPTAILLERIISRLKKDNNYDINDIIEEIKRDPQANESEVKVLTGLFEAALTWGVFAPKSESSTAITDLLKEGITTVIDLSVYSSISTFNVRALVIGIISRKLFNERVISRKKEEVESIRRGEDYLAYTQKRDIPLAWIFIDEAHEFLPKEGKTFATEPLVQILREGRQPGISLVLATQQPGQIHKDVMTQSDIVISHKLTSQADISALNEIMQTYLFESIKKSIDNLPNLKGSAIILDDNSERIYSIRIRPRFTWHGGEAPAAIKLQKRVSLF